mmetsp:Transcript_140217/g.198749  ORF Transcript_140217/g.198749 Transcript_140217/m.198749 type:complete len:392 (+) Transcript_140217:123-1298(+)
MMLGTMTFASGFGSIGFLAGRTAQLSCLTRGIRGETARRLWRTWRTWRTGTGRGWSRRFRGYNGICGLSTDATHTSGTLHTPLNENIAIHAPVGVPRILHLPIRNAIQSAVAHQENCMVQVGSTLGLDNPTLVGLESRRIGINGNGHWLLNNCFHKCVHIICIYILITSNTTFWDTNRTGGSITSSEFGFVRITIFSAHIRSLCIFEGWILVATMTSIFIPTFSAIYQLLFGQGHQISSRNKQCTLQCSGAGKCPAGATKALILHWCDSTLGNPVPVIRQSLAAVMMGAQMLGRTPKTMLFGRLFASISGKLFMCEISKLVNAKLIGMTLGILLHDVLVSLTEESKAVCFFLRTGIVLVPLSLKLVEGRPQRIFARCIQRHTCHECCTTHS